METVRVIRRDGQTDTGGKRNHTNQSWRDHHVVNSKFIEFTVKKKEIKQQK